MARTEFESRFPRGLLLTTFLDCLLTYAPLLGRKGGSVRPGDALGYLFYNRSTKISPAPSLCQALAWLLGKQQ